MESSVFDDAAFSSDRTSEVKNLLVDLELEVGVRYNLFQRSRSCARDNVAKANVYNFRTQTERVR